MRETFCLPRGTPRVSSVDPG